MSLRGQRWPTAPSPLANPALNINRALRANLELAARISHPLHPVQATTRRSNCPTPSISRRGHPVTRSASRLLLSRVNLACCSRVPRFWPPSSAWRTAVRSSAACLVPSFRRAERCGSREDNLRIAPEKVQRKHINNKQLHILHMIEAEPIRRAAVPSHTPGPSEATPLVDGTSHVCTPRRRVAARRVVTLFLRTPFQPAQRRYPSTDRRPVVHSRRSILAAKLPRSVGEHMCTGRRGRTARARDTIHVLGSSDERALVP